MGYVIMTKSSGNCKNLFRGVDDPLRGDEMRIVPLAEETRQRRAIRDLVQANTEAQDYFVKIARVLSTHRQCMSSLSMRPVVRLLWR